MTLLTQFNDRAGLRFWGPVLPFLVLLFTGCDPSDDNNADNFDRGAYLTETADNIIVPAYAEFAEESQSLKQALDALVLGQVSAEDIIASRETLRETYMAWQRVQLFDFGPAINRALLVTTNTYPTDPAEIAEAALLPSWTGGLPGILDSSGLPALEWLMFSEDATATAVTWNEETSGRLSHARRLATFMADEAEAVHSSWTSGYRDSFVASTGTEAGSSIGEMLNAFNRVYEANIRKGKLGLPNGSMTFSQTPQPELVEAPFAAMWSVDFLAESLKSCAHVYFGDDNNGSTNALGLDDYLKSLGDVSYGEGLHDDIAAQLSSAETAIASLEDPLATFVVEQQAASYDVYGELQALVVLWKVDMMSSLGVLITYQDNDGD